MTDSKRLKDIEETHRVMCLGEEGGLGEDDIDFLIVQARKFEELRRWFLWLKRRTHNGETPRLHVVTFLQAIKEYFEPNKED
jgi:hypothetical protein